MKLTVFYEENDGTFEADVKLTDHLDTLITIIEAELSVPADQLSIHHNSKVLTTQQANMTLQEIGIGNHDIILVKNVNTKPPDVPSHYLSRPKSVDVRAQQIIEEEIQKQNIRDNLADAIDSSPESFAKVLMLYVDVEINGEKIQAFVDSGAQSTIMSKTLAARCDLLRLVDTRFAGTAVGVGSAKILGRIHKVDMKIGAKSYPCSFTVLDDQIGNMDFLLGLDMLKRHQCMIDLKNNLLHMGDDAVLPFLPEAELPDHARLTPKNPYEY